MTDQIHSRVYCARFSLRSLLVASSISVISTHGAIAQEGPYAGPGEERDWKISVSAGIMYGPAFTGSEDYQTMVFPDLKIEYKDRFFASIFDGIGYNFINNDTWRVGASVGSDFGRKEDDDNPFRIAGKETKALAGLGDVDETVTVGGFVEYNFHPLTFELDLRQGLTGHEGFYGEAGLKYNSFFQMSGRPIMVSAGPHALFGDEKYINANFGITPTQSAASGLSEYSADAGLVSYGIDAFALTPISDSLSFGVFAGYDRLTGDAADSPLIQLRGDENQFTAGVLFSYEFGR